MDKVPEWAKEKALRSLNKTNSYAEFNKKKGYYEIRVCFNEELNVISTSFQKKITIKHLKILLEMANYLDALLLNNGTQIIDEKVIEDLEKDSKQKDNIETSEIHIYVPKENITKELLDNWNKELSKITKQTKIEFEIKTLEDFIK